MVFEEVLKLAGTSPWKDIWPVAQLILPPNRRRTFANSSTISFATNDYREWITKRHAAVQTKVHAAADAALTVQKPSMPEPVVEQEPQIIVIEKPIRMEPDYRCIPTSTLVTILLERLGRLEAMQEAVIRLEQAATTKQAMDTQYERRADPRPHPKPPEPERAIRIVIVGPLDSQEQDIRNKVAGAHKKVDLRFYDKDKLNRDLPMTFDYCIVSKHVNHSWWEKCKAALPADRVFFVQGNGAIIQKIFDLTSRQ